MNNRMFLLFSLNVLFLLPSHCLPQAEETSYIVVQTNPIRLKNRIPSTGHNDAPCTKLHKNCIGPIGLVLSNHRRPGSSGFRISAPVRSITLKNSSVLVENPLKT
jgi:hypothetical protein